MQPILSAMSGAVARAKASLAGTHKCQRRSLLAGAALAATLIMAGTPAWAQLWSTEQWTATWGTAPTGSPPDASTQTFNDQTLRLIVHSSVGGTRARIRVSNEFGTTALRLGAARIALRASGSDIAPGSDRALTFSGQEGIVIPPGARVLSDPVELNVPPLSDIAVSLYLPGEVRASTLHGTALQTSFVSLPGNFAASATLPVQRSITNCPFLTGVDVQTSGAAVVALGDSITDGTRSPIDTHSRWTDWLARRLQTARESRIGVINRGIGGNRLLGDSSNPLAGRSVLERFERDVLPTAGVKYLVLMIGINDIGNSSPAQPVTALDLIAGYRQVIARAHAKGIAVYGATLTPFEGAAYYSAEKELVRQTVNNWIRTADEFDGVIDFDAATRDPARPSRFLPAFDSGDHLHPSDRGYEAMGNAVPLALFRSPAAGTDTRRAARK